MSQLLTRKSVDLDNIEGRQRTTYDELDDIGMVAPVPEPEHKGRPPLSTCPVSMLQVIDYRSKRPSVKTADC
eukprot:scaffold314131_cov18-Tisochrysis_lutea.AAC.2